MYDRTLIVSAIMPCSQSAGMEARRDEDHRQCHHSLDWVPYPLVMRVSQRVECDSDAAAPAVLTIRRVSRR
jgi:hypothetical protein